MRTGKALDISIPNLNGEVLSHALIAVDMIANLEVKAVGTQLLRETYATVQHLQIEDLLPVFLVEVKELRSKVALAVRLHNGSGI